MRRLVSGGKAETKSVAKTQKNKLPGWTKAAIPIAGSITGGVAGAGLGGIAGIPSGLGAVATGYAGAVGGAGLGAAGGQSLVNLIERYMNTGNPLKPASDETLSGNISSIKNQAIGGGLAQAIGGPLGSAGGKALSGLSKGILFPAFGRAGNIISKLGMKGSNADEIMQEIPKTVEVLVEKLNTVLKNKTGMTIGQFDKLMQKLSVPEKTGALSKKTINNYKGALISARSDLTKGSLAPLQDSFKLPLNALQKLKQTTSQDVNWGNPDMYSISKFANQMTGALKENIETASGAPKTVRSINQLLSQLIDLQKSIPKRNNMASNYGRILGLPLGSLSIGTLLGNPLLGGAVAGGTALLEKPEISLALGKLLRSQGIKITNKMLNQLLPRLLLQGGQPSQSQ